MDTFGEYGLVGGVRVPFAVWIGVWHGLFSVLAPALLVQYLFPATAAVPWLPYRATWLLSIVAAAPAVANFLFFGDADPRVVGHTAFVVVAGLVLWFLAGRLPRTPGPVPATPDTDVGWRPFAAGAALYVGTSLVPEMLAQSRVPAPWFLLYMAVVVGGAAWAAARRRQAARVTVVVFVLGSVTAQAVLAVVFGVLIGDVQWVLAGVLFTVASSVLLIRVRRDRPAVSS